MNRSILLALAATALTLPAALSAQDKKPDAAAADNYLITHHPELDAGVSRADARRMMYLNGTSMATPAVAGAAAAGSVLTTRSSPPPSSRSSQSARRNWSIVRSVPATTAPAGQDQTETSRDASACGASSTPCRQSSSGVSSGAL